MLQQLGDGRQIVKLIDFGVARVESSSVSTDTAVIGLAGTPSYMAPEHVSGKPVPASDIFSLGVIAYEMLTAKRPLRRNSRSLCVNSKSRESHDVRSAVSGPICRKKRRRPSLQSLDYEPSRRPSNPRELCDTIGLALERVISAAPKPRDRRGWLKAPLPVGWAP